MTPPPVESNRTNAPFSVRISHSQSEKKHTFVLSLITNSRVAFRGLKRRIMTCISGKKYKAWTHQVDAEGHRGDRRTHKV